MDTPLRILIASALCFLLGGTIVLVGAPALLVSGIRPTITQLVKWSAWMGVAAVVAAIIELHA